MLNFYHASKLSQSELLRGVFLTLAEQDELIRALPWTRANGLTQTYQREGAAMTANFIPEGGSVTEGSETFMDVTAHLRSVGDSVDIPRALSDNMGDGLAQIQISARVKAMGRLLKQKLITGDFPTVTVGATQPVGFVTAAAGSAYLKTGTGKIFLDVSENTVQFQAPGDTEYGAIATYVGDAAYWVTSADGVQKVQLTLDVSEEGASDCVFDITISSAGYQFDGLKKIMSTGIPAAQYTAATNGEALAFDTFRALQDKVKITDGLPSFVLSPELVRAYKTLVDAKMTADAYIELPNYGMVKQLAFDGCPVFKDEFIVQTETQGTAAAKCSHMYCVVLSSPTGAPSVAGYMGAGLCGLYGAGIEAETPQNPVMGVNIDQVNLPSDGDGKTKMVTRYVVSGYYALALYSTAAAACRYGVYVV